MSDATDRALAAQYEAFPYPERDPRDEAKRLIVGSPSHLLEIDHWVFGARRPATQPLRALIAGGGSGDAAIMLAQQMAMAGRPGEVVWLDRSAAARRIAEARAAVRRLANIRFVEGSLLDLTSLGLGAFDYVDCCGVLHHLPDPAAGLAALAGVVAPGGGIGLMVYAPHGRTGVYMLQDALRLLAPPGEAPRERVEIAKRLWKHLPETAWLKRNAWITDHVSGGDAGIYDLLLNPRDVAFSVPALVELVEGAGLRVASFIEPLRYDPARFLPDPRLRERIAALSPVERASVAEAAAGNMGIHILYATRSDEPPVEVAWTESSVPVLRELNGPKLAAALKGGVLPVVFDGLRVSVPLPPLAAALLRRVDGVTPAGEIIAAVAREGAGEQAARRDWAALVAAMAPLNRLLAAAPQEGGDA